ncbi:MAG TPA: DivIVA domain-containing protein [Myxococcota bacterium]|nr:DivIVA domain-containing protein [Myxococcota bacterium]
MKLSPIDIQQQQFSRAWRGYEPREVHHFLDMLAQEMAALVRENTDLKGEARRVQRELDELRSREQSLKDAMLTAQRAIDEVRDQARKEAELIVGEAEMRSEKILHNANTKVTKILEEVNDLRRQRVRFLEELRGVVNTHARLLDVHAQEARENPPEASVTVLERLRAPAPPAAEEASRVQGR